MKKSATFLLRVAENISAAAALEAFLNEYSTSKTLTSESPAQERRVWSLEWGINLTEKIFAVWPVFIEVVRANGDVDESG